MDDIFFTFIVVYCHFAMYSTDAHSHTHTMCMCTIVQTGLLSYKSKIEFNIEFFLKYVLQ